MNSEEIQKFLTNNKISDKKMLKITFRKRNPVYGVFVQFKDAEELQAKNF